MSEQERLLAAYIKNKERKSQSRTENIESKAKGWFAVVTSIIAFGTSLTALGAVRQSDELRAILSEVPRVSYNTTSSTLKFYNNSTLTFVK